ncbi:MAG TPA: hypothetical protein VI006_01355 [Solirubrobacteraceae bacterium]
MTKILVVANETIGGRSLIEKVQERAGQDVRYWVVVPRARPRRGNVVYDEAVRDMAQVRVDLMLAFMRDNGIKGGGEVGDPDPFLAATDAVAAEGIDQIIVSTLPAETSGWMKRDLPERLRETTGLPVEHVISDVVGEGLPFDVTLVAANVTVASEELHTRLKQLAEESPHRFIVVVPQAHVEGHAVGEARERLAQLLKSLRDEGIVAAGMIGDPDPFTAIMNAVDYFFISEIVISTLPEASSKWVADKLVDRVQSASNKPVEHIESVGAGAQA